MTASARVAASQVVTGSARMDGEIAQGWYLYGITRPTPLAEILAEVDPRQQDTNDPGAFPADAAPLHLLEHSGLAAVVRRVSLPEFSPTLLRERLQDESTLEAMVRGHNRVTEAIHRRQAILPAKFGSVYPRVEDLVEALRSAHDRLMHQLDKLEGCDEWAVHLYADPAVVRERIAHEHPAIRQLRERCTASRPGRAFFLDRQLREKLDCATERELDRVAESAFESLRRFAAAAQVNAIRPLTDTTPEVEILRASFLVVRGTGEDFQRMVHAAADTRDAVRCDCTGPWPPYSFAGPDAAEAT